MSSSTKDAAKNTMDPLDVCGEFSVRGSGWVGPRDHPPGGFFVGPGECAMIRHRFPVPVDRVLVELAPASVTLRVYAVRAGDRVLWCRRRQSCAGKWVVAVPPARDDYVVVEVEHAGHDLTRLVPLCVVLWANQQGDSDVHGVAVGYSPSDLGMASFAKTRSILLLPQRPPA